MSARGNDGSMQRLARTLSSFNRNGQRPARAAATNLASTQPRRPLTVALKRLWSRPKAAFVHVGLEALT